VITPRLDVKSVIKTKGKQKKKKQRERKERELK
jgi:hypothetical protein